MREVRQEDLVVHQDEDVLFSISADVPREEEPLALICGLWGEYSEKVILEAGFEVTIK